MLTSKLESKRWVMTFTPHLHDAEWDWLANKTDFWVKIFDEDLRDGKGDYSMVKAQRYLPKYLAQLGINCVIVECKLKAGGLGRGEMWGT